MEAVTPGNHDSVIDPLRHSPRLPIGGVSLAGNSVKREYSRPVGSQMKNFVGRTEKTVTIAADLK